AVARRALGGRPPERARDDLGVLDAERDALAEQGVENAGQVAPGVKRQRLEGGVSLLRGELAGRRDPARQREAALAVGRDRLERIGGPLGVEGHGRRQERLEERAEFARQ